MTKPKDITSTKEYAALWADYEAQCETVYNSIGPQTQDKSDAEINAIQKEFKKDQKYKLLVKHNFQPPTTTGRMARSDLDAIVETHGL